MSGISLYVGVIGMQPITTLIKIKSIRLSSHIIHVLLMHALTSMIATCKNHDQHNGEEMNNISFVVLGEEMNNMLEMS